MQTIISFASLALIVGTVSAETPDGTKFEFFEKKVRPVLVEHCYPCHATNSKKENGGLLLDSRDALRRGTLDGPVLTPGKPEQSRLIKAIRYTDAKHKMPPRGKLPEPVIADLESWVRQGAADPREKVTPASAVGWEETLRQRRSWWSLQPVRPVAAPSVTDATWPISTIDRFILAKQEEKGLQPAGDTEARTLLRRLSLVVTGLPPLEAEVADFEKEHRLRPQAAVEKAVDRLLASPHFGERWARHWMDVVHFSETHGNEWNYDVHHAWRYRDYLIRAFNDDVPYDQFVREHIAGDLMQQPRWNRTEGFNESVIGTAFYRFGEVNHDDCITLPQIGYDLADNQIDTLTKTFQATTVACARCHDHKIDAVSMKDYYALLGILRSSRLVSHTLDAASANAGPMRRLRELKPAIREELGELWLRDAREVGRYLLAAQAKRSNSPEISELAKGLDSKRLENYATLLSMEKQPLEDLFEPWRLLAAVKSTDPASLSGEWKKIRDRYAKEEHDRSVFNEKQFVTYSDFRSTAQSDWQVGGQGLMDGATSSGDIVLAVDGDAALRTILPAGYFTHTLSERLNGTLRSPVLTTKKKYISFRVIGQRSSAVRLVSGNCQLNYANYRALTSSDLGWVTFPIPEGRDRLRVYAELMTMFDNPKFPDQLSALGGDKENYRLPWEKAVANPRSYFGVTQVVLHDDPTPPKLEIAFLRPLIAAPAPTTLKDLANRYANTCEAAVRAWSADRATDEQAHLLNILLQPGLLSNNQALTSRLKMLVELYRETEAELALPRVAPGMADCGAGFDQPIFTRGDCLKPSEPAPRRYLEVLSKEGDRFSPQGSGRLELAEQIARRSNPLTARVMVNRVWHHLFGAGLVRTVDDFGRVGDRPSHPELLDYLAGRFVDEGWSVKKLIREIVLTRTFQTADKPPRSAREIDPENRLLSYYPARRMEAEAIRDSILCVSGRLDRTLYGQSIPSFREKENADRRLFPGPLDGNGRRSIYIKNTLMEAPRFLGAFDFPGGKVTQGKRDVTNVPGQALALLNDPFVLQQAGVWAKQLVAHHDESIEARIERMFQTALNRRPRKEETRRCEQALYSFAQLHQTPASSVLASEAVWQDLGHAMFNMKEFIYIP